MTEAQVFLTGYLSSIALLAALAVVIGLMVMLQVVRFMGRWVAMLLVPAMGLGMALSSALSGRNLKYASISIETINEGGPAGGGGVLRVLTLTLVCACAATILSARFGTHRHQQRSPGAPLIIAFAFYYVGNAMLNAAFGTVPSISHHVVYLPLVFGAVYVWRDRPVEDFIGAAKWMLLAFMAGSLVAAAVKPSLAVQTGYAGWVPGLKIRLWGLGSNPNSIGPVAMLLMLLEWMQPSRQRWLRLLVWGSAAAVLVLAQSKTAWAALLAVTPVLAWQRYGRAPTGGVRIGFVLVVIAALLAMGLVVAWVDLGRILDKLASSQVGSDLSTLTGRARIWAEAVNAWKANLLFGYGPTAWGPLHRLEIGLPFAFSAHNQFLQSLSVAGLAGLFGLLVYMVVLGVMCWRAHAATNGVSLALYLVVLVRCLTEAPYTPSTLFNGDSITHLVLFRIALLGARPASAAGLVRSRLQPRMQWQ